MRDCLASAAYHGNPAAPGRVWMHPKLGTTTRKDGTLQVTYNGWPLYYYEKDKAAGDVTGQDVGGVWFVVSAAGEKVVAEHRQRATEAPAAASRRDHCQSGTRTTHLVPSWWTTKECHSICLQRILPIRLFATINVPLPGLRCSPRVLLWVVRAWMAQTWHHHTHGWNRSGDL